MDLVDYNKVIDVLRLHAYPIIGRWDVQEKGLDLYTIHLALRDLDRVDAKPVIHAHWTGVSPMVDTIMCSNCGWNYPTNDFATPYCPSCGAKMDEEVE